MRCTLTKCRTFWIFNINGLGHAQHILWSTNPDMGLPEEKIKIKLYKVHDQKGIDHVFSMTNSIHSTESGRPIPRQATVSMLRVLC